MSRGDKSGTEALEKRLWRAAGIDPAGSGAGTWYREIGGGMGAALNAAAGMDAYTLSDRGTWLSFRNKGPLVVLFEGDALLVNRYRKQPVPKQALARRFAQWLLSSEGQAAIGVYMISVSSYSILRPRLQSDGKVMLAHRLPSSPQRRGAGSLTRARERRETVTCQDVP